MVKGGVQDLRGLTLIGDGAAARAPTALGLPVGRRGGHRGLGRMAFGRRGGCEGGGGTFGGSGSSRWRPFAHLQFLHKRLRQIHSYHLDGEMIKTDIQQRTFNRIANQGYEIYFKKHMKANTALLEQLQENSPLELSSEMEKVAHKVRKFRD